MSSLHLTIEASLDAVPAAGDGVRRFCVDSGIDAPEAALVELAVVEALQNTIQHGYAGQPGALELDARIDDLRIQAMIRDTAPPISASAVAPAPIVHEDAGDRDSLRERGRGLAIIREVFDEVVFSRSDGHNCLALSRTRHRGPQ